MSDSLAGIVLAAGRGERLRPLTRFVPKPLCPVDGTPLVDHALGRLRPVTASLAVNLHHGREALADHLGSTAPAVHRSVEPDEPRGTAGALGLLRDWIDGRPVIIVNGDTWCPGSAAALVDGWDGERIRIYVHGADELGPGSAIAGALMPWSDVAPLGSDPAGLYETSWREAATAGRLEVVRHDGAFVDCATPADYLRANLTASDGASVVGAGAVVEGTVERCVLWSGAVVDAGEHLVDAIRIEGRVTVLVRPARRR